MARVLGVLCSLLSLYYLRFFLERHESFTVIQMVTLVAAATSFFLQEPRGAVSGVWFRDWKPTAWQGWLGAIAMLALVVWVFLVMDSDSHSVSDTLTRVAPTVSLLGALASRVWLDHRAPAAEQD